MRGIIEGGEEREYRMKMGKQEEREAGKEKK